MPNNIEPLLQEPEIILDEKGHLTPVIPDSERFILNRLGYKIEARNGSGEWLERITIVDDNGEAIHILDANKLTTKDAELNEVLDSVMERTLYVNLPSTVKDRFRVLKTFVEEFNEQDKPIDQVMEKVLTKAASKQYPSLDAPLVATVIRDLTAYLVAYEYPRLTVDRAQEIAGVKVGSKQNSYGRLFLMDDAYGPFTSEEMGVIQESLWDESLNIPLDSRVMILLCIEWGLRPIQLSLLKESDFYYNSINDCYWLNVPRVKQKQRDRRTQFKKRMISNGLGRLIQRMIDENEWTKAYYLVDDMPLFQRRFARYRHEDEETGLVTVQDKCMINPHRPKYGEKKDPYSFHIATQRILYRFHEVEDYLPLSPRTGKPFNLTAYRFRYTRGTMAVANGMTAAEVAELLDHSNTDSVSHYFKNSEHLWEVIQEATTSRVEQRHFTAKWMTKAPEEQNMYAIDITERNTLTTVGQCHKGGCELEPAVACYSCSNFQPNDDVNAHKQAREVIIELSEFTKSHSSTGAPQHIFDEALVGVEAAIVHADKSEDVLGIYDGEPKDLQLESLNPALALEADHE